MPQRKEPRRAATAMRNLFPLLLTASPSGGCAARVEQSLAHPGWARAACRFQLGPAFFVFLRRHGVWDALPGDHRATLEEEYQRNLAWFMAREGVLAEVVGLLKSLGQSPVLLKGLAFACELYPDPAARFAGDIDLMIDFAFKEQATRCLEGAGIERLAHGARRPGPIKTAWRRLTRRERTADEGETVFRARVGDHDVLIEVHYHLINLRAGGGKERIFCSHTETARELRTLQAPFGEVRVLTPLEAFVHALRHLALHHRLIGFRWHHDLALMLERWEQLDAVELRERCRALNSEKILDVELAILRDLFGKDAFPRYDERLWKSGALPWEYPLYRHTALGGVRTPLRELVRTLLAPTLREQAQALT